MFFLSSFFSHQLSARILAALSQQIIANKRNTTHSHTQQNDLKSRVWKPPPVPKQDTKTQRGQTKGRVFENQTVIHTWMLGGVGGISGMSGLTWWRNAETCCRSDELTGEQLNISLNFNMNSSHISVCNNLQQFYTWTCSSEKITLVTS